MSNILIFIVPVIAVVLLAVIFLIKKNKKTSNKEEVLEEFPINTNLELMDGPLEPLGTMVDKEFEGLPAADSNLKAVEQIQEESIKPVFNLSIDQPLTAQEKGSMQVEEKKEEVNTRLDDFKECPTCHTKVEPSATVCFLCGSKLN